MQDLQISYAVGVFVYQKMIFIFSYYACVLLLSLQNIVIHCTVVDVGWPNR